MDRIENLAETAKQDLKKKYGIVFTEISGGSVTGELPLKEEYVNMYGIPYGGMMFHLADVTAGMAFVSAGGYGVTVSGTADFMRAAPPDAKKLICRAEAVRMGRRISFIDADVFDGAGLLLAKMHFTYCNE